MKQKKNDLHNNSVLLTLQDSFVIAYDKEKCYN